MSAKFPKGGGGSKPILSHPSNTLETGNIQDVAIRVLIPPVRSYPLTVKIFYITRIVPAEQVKTAFISPHDFWSKL